MFHLLFVSSILFCSFVLCASICRYLFESIPSIKKVSFPTNIYVCCLLYISHASLDIQFLLFALGSSQHTNQEAFNKIHPEMLLCMPFMWRHLSRLQSIWMNTCCNRARGQHRHGISTILYLVRLFFWFLSNLLSYFDSNYYFKVHNDVSWKVVLSFRFVWWNNSFHLSVAIRMSVGAALTSLSVWLIDIQRLVLDEEDIPQLASIVTVYGLLS